MNTNLMNPLVLAYIGDAVYELKIRNFLVSKKINKVNELQKEAVSYVSAKSQALFIDRLIDNGILAEEELDIYKRGRNSKVISHPKNTDIITYKKATGFECLFGYLYINQKYDRIDELLSLLEV